MSCETIYQCTLTKNRSKTPKEIREEFERLAKEREERAMQRRINPTSRLTMRVNATDLFERYMYDEIYDDVIPPSLPSLKISEISFGQTIEAPLSLTDKLIISGNVRYGTYKDIARLHEIILVIKSLALKMAQEQDQLDAR